MNKGKLIEAGHYYQCLGPTKNAHIGMQIANILKETDDKIMLFVDDVHEHAGFEEGQCSVNEANSLHQQSDFVKYESETVPVALPLIEDFLKSIDTQFIREDNGGVYYKGVKLLEPTKNGKIKPTCVSMDAALTSMKNEMGFDYLINILAMSYSSQQKNLHVVLNALKNQGLINPAVQLFSLLFDNELNGAFNLGYQPKNPNANKIKMNKNFAKVNLQKEKINMNSKISLPFSYSS